MRNIFILLSIVGAIAIAQSGRAQTGSTASGTAVPVAQPKIPAATATSSDTRPANAPAPKATLAPTSKPAAAKTAGAPPVGKSVTTTKDSGPALSMREYFSQVGGNNPAYRAAKESYDGARKRNDEPGFLFLPQLSVNYEDGMTEKPNTQPNFQGTRTDRTKWDVTVSQDTPIGLKGAISYGSMFTDISGASPTFVPIARYYEITPSIELTQSLWRNGFGSEVRAQESLYRAQQNLDLYTERQKLEGIRIEAERTYNKLFFAREILTARRDSVDVSSKIYSWARGRAANELGEDSDMVQAQAAQELRQLELLKAEDDVREASRAFNSLRGINGDQVADDLEAPVPVTPTKFDYNALIQSDELRLAEAQLKIAEAQGKLNRERLTPVLDIYGKYALNGLDPQDEGDSAASTRAVDDAWNGDHPAYAVGIRFKAGLFFWKTEKAKEGYRQQIEAAGLRLKRQAQVAERDQVNLLARLQNTKKRFELAQQLQKTQQNQLERERLRHRRGRTTLFQVLTFEGQYVASRLSVIQYQNELLDQINDLSLYRGE